MSNQRVKPIGSFTFEDFKAAVSELDQTVAFEKLKNVYQANLDRQVMQYTYNKQAMYDRIGLSIAVITFVGVVAFLIWGISTWVNQGNRILAANVDACNKAQASSCMLAISQEEDSGNYGQARALAAGYQVAAGKPLPLPMGDMHLYSLPGISVSRGGYANVNNPRADAPGDNGADGAPNDDCLLVRVHGKKYLIDPDSNVYDFTSSSDTASGWAWTPMIDKPNE